MTEEKTIRSRQQQKIDTSERWLEAGEKGFVPKSGEIIVYSDLHKIKVGDGETKVHELEFISDLDPILKRLENMPFEYLVGTEEKPILLRQLENGIYYIEGYVQYNEKASVFQTSTGLFIVQKLNSVSKLIRFAPEAAMLRCYSIYNEWWESYPIELTDIDTALNLAKNAVSYNDSQGLTQEQQIQACNNIGALYIDGIEDVARITAPFVEVKDLRASQVSTKAVTIGEEEASLTTTEKMSEELEPIGVVHLDINYGVQQEFYFNNQQVITKNILEEVVSKIGKKPLIISPIIENDCIISPVTSQQIVDYDIYEGPIFLELALFGSQFTDSYAPLSRTEGDVLYFEFQNFEFSINGNAIIMKRQKTGEIQEDNGEIFNNYENNKASGSYSHAEGSYTNAAGTGAHSEGAEGYNDDGTLFEKEVTFNNPTIAEPTPVTVTVTGPYAYGHASHAEGVATLACGSGAHAEGCETFAYGGRSHAEGTRSQALGPRSHAEGGDTVAVGIDTHAQGTAGQAIGRSAHVEGYNTNYAAEVIPYYDAATDGVTKDEIAANHKTKKYHLAYGRASHVEGASNLSFGEGAHAEGKYTQALADRSHAEGYNTVASGNQSHAEGNANTASGDSAHAEGTSSVASGNYSHAEGGITEASGQYSHAEGWHTIAASSSQHVQGRYNIADRSTNPAAKGKYAHIVGGGDKEDEYDDEGNLVTQNRKNIHTLDWKGNGWFAEKVTVGADNKALITEDEANELITQALENFDGDYATTDYVDAHYVTAGLKEGVTAGQRVTAEGKDTAPTGYAAHAEGRETEATKSGAHAEGYRTVASGEYSHAEGGSTDKLNTNETARKWLEASGSYSHAEGRDTRASGNAAHAEGKETIASGSRAHAEGGGTQALGASSHAEGETSVAKGGYSHAEGGATESIGEYSHAEGFHTIAASAQQHVQGRYNLIDTASDGKSSSRGQYAHIVGNGASESSRSNAHTVDWNGNGWFAGDVVSQTSGKLIGKNDVVNETSNGLMLAEDKRKLDYIDVNIDYEHVSVPGTLGVERYLTAQHLINTPIYWELGGGISTGDIYAGDDYSVRKNSNDVDVSFWAKDQVGSPLPVRITGLTDGIRENDAVTKYQLDCVASSIHPKITSKRAPTQPDADEAIREAKEIWGQYPDSRYDPNGAMWIHIQTIRDEEIGNIESIHPLGVYMLAVYEDIGVWVKLQSFDPLMWNFTIEGTEYTCEAGMDWDAWVNSEYNTGGFKYIYSSRDDCHYVTNTAGSKGLMVEQGTPESYPRDNRAYTLSSIE